MSTRIGNTHKPVIDKKTGKTVLVPVKRRYDICTELKQKGSKKVRVVKPVR